MIEANRRLDPLLIDLENGLSLQVVVPLEEAVDRIPYEGLDVERVASMLWDVRGFVGDVEEAQTARQIGPAPVLRRIPFSGFCG